MDVAHAGLSVATAQIAVVSQNIANQGNSTASRKIANVITVNGVPTVASVTRASNAALQKSLLSANGSQAQQSAISSALTQLQTTVESGSNSSNSLSSLIGQLNDALQTYSAAPQNTASAQAAVIAAQNLAQGLRNASATVQTVRDQADSDIAGSVATIKNLLLQFQQVNQTIVNGTAAGTDVNDAMDQRDSLLQQLSSQIGITTVTGANNDVKIYTDSGVTLFDETPRSVTFVQTVSLSPGVPGNAVYADGVPITVTGSSFSIQTGALAGLVQVRDSIGITYQSQLDEIASGLITDFQETDQSGGTALPQAGLFTDGSDLQVPSIGTVDAGLASTITVASSVISNPSLLRDGGISSNGAAPYVYNPQPGDAGYSGRLTDLITNLSNPLAFASSADAGTQISVADFAAGSASWLGTKAQQASTAASYSTAVQSSASTALSNSTGVNLDNELTNMLALEQSYQASAKLLNSINTLYASLFAAIQ